MKTFDDEFHFKGYGNCDSRCRLRVYKAEKGLHRGDTIVIASQLEGENVGTSVTNAAEIIADAATKRFQLMPTRTVWIEHYPELKPARSQVEKEHFDRVAFDYQLQAPFPPRFRRATWNRLDREQVAALIGEQP